MKITKILLLSSVAIIATNFASTAFAQSKSICEVLDGRRDQVTPVFSGAKELPLPLYKKDFAAIPDTANFSAGANSDATLVLKGEQWHLVDSEYGFVASPEADQAFASFDLVCPGYVIGKLGDKNYADYGDTDFYSWRFDIPIQYHADFSNVKIPVRTGDNESAGTYKEFAISYTLIFDYFHDYTAEDFADDADYFQKFKFDVNTKSNRMKDDFNITPTFSNADIISQSVNSGWLAGTGKVRVDYEYTIKPKDYFPVNISLNKTPNHAPHAEQYVMDSTKRVETICENFSRGSLWLSPNQETREDFVKTGFAQDVLNKERFPKSDLEKALLVIDGNSYPLSDLSKTDSVLYPKSSVAGPVKLSAHYKCGNTKSKDFSVFVNGLGELKLGETSDRKGSTPFTIEVLHEYAGAPDVGAFDATYEDLIWESDKNHGFTVDNGIITQFDSKSSGKVSRKKNDNGGYQWRKGYRLTIDPANDGPVTISVLGKVLQAGYGQTQTLKIPAAKAQATTPRPEPAPIKPSLPSVAQTSNTSLKLGLLVGNSFQLKDISAGAVTDWKVTDNLPDNSWDLVAFGDVDNSGERDLLWRHKATSGLVYWELKNGKLASGPQINKTIDKSWGVVGMADVDGDKTHDIVFFKPDTGLKYWSLDAGQFKSENTIYSGNLSDWRVPGVGDVNGDGTANIVFENKSTGQVVGWNVVKGKYKDGFDLSGAKSGRSVAGIADVNGDGRDDLLVRYDADKTKLRVWEMKADRTYSETELPITLGAQSSVLVAASNIALPKRVTPSIVPTAQTCDIDKYLGVLASVYGAENAIDAIKKYGGEDMAGQETKLATAKIDAASMEPACRAKCDIDTLKLQSKNFHGAHYTYNQVVFRGQRQLGHKNTIKGQIGLYQSAMNNAADACR